MEGYELEETERSMKGWCQVRRKGGQVEKDVAAETRGREEFSKFIASYPWCKERTVEEWKQLESESWNEKRKEFESWSAYWKEVMEWRGRGGVV